MFSADEVTIKRSLSGMSHLEFVGSRLITAARYLSGWTFPALSELYRIRASSFPITIQPRGHLLLARWQQQYQVIEIDTGDVVSVCPGGQEFRRYDSRYALSECGGFIIDGVHGVIRVREIRTGAVVWERPLDRAELSAIWSLHNGTQWALCVNPINQAGETRRPASVEVWDWPLGAQPKSIFQRDYVPFGSSVSNTGLIAFPGFRDKPARVFDLASGRAAREFVPPDGNRSSGYVHWICDDRVMVAWENVLCEYGPDGAAQRTFHLPTYSPYSVAATADLLALAYHDRFVLVRLDRIPNSETEIELSPPWSDPPQSRQTEDVDHSFVTPAPDSHRSVPGETPDELRNALREFERPAWIPQVRFRPGDVTSSKLGGTPFISQTEEWPCCGVCSRPMELFLQLNSEQLPRELAQRFSGLLQVFLCVTNGYSTGTCALGYEGSSTASMLRLCNPLGQPRYQRPPFDDAFIEGVIESWQPLQDLPSLQDLRALGIELSDAQERLIIDLTERFAWPGDKLGGWPNWPQNLDYIACRRCKRRMDVIFQIDSGDTLPHGFMDGGTAWISQCADHPDVLALNWNS